VLHSHNNFGGFALVANPKNDRWRHSADSLGRIKRARKNTHNTVPKRLREKGRSGNAAAFRRIGGVGGQLVLLLATIG